MKTKQTIRKGERGGNFFFFPLTVSFEEIKSEVFWGKGEQRSVRFVISSCR